VVQPPHLAAAFSNIQRDAIGLLPNQQTAPQPSRLGKVEEDENLDQDEDEEDEEEESKSSSVPLPKMQPQKRKNEDYPSWGGSGQRTDQGQVTGPLFSPSPMSAPVVASQGSSDDAILIIEEQPAQFGRFRYLAEARMTYLEGRRPGTYPTVRINDKYKSYIPNGTLVHAKIVTRYNDARGQPIPHWHTLSGKDGLPPSQPLVNGRCVFRNLVIQRHRTAEKHNAADQRSARILFSLSFSLGHEQRTTYVITTPVFNADLKIDRLSHSSCPAEGGVSIFILCSKVCSFLRLLVRLTTADSEEDDRAAHQRQPLRQLCARKP
jgi:hypothetical protein